MRGLSRSLSSGVSTTSYTSCGPGFGETGRGNPLLLFLCVLGATGGLEDDTPGVAIGGLVEGSFLAPGIGTGGLEEESLLLTGVAIGGLEDESCLVTGVAIGGLEAGFGSDAGKRAWPD